MTFLLDPTLLEMEGGRYVGPILPVFLEELVSGKRGVGGSSRGSGVGGGKIGDRKGDRCGGGGGSGGSRDGGRGGGTGQDCAGVGGKGSRSSVRVWV